MIAAAVALLAAAPPPARAATAGAPRRLKESGTSAVSDVAVSPDGLTVAVATVRDDLQLWHVPDATLRSTLRAEAPPASVEFSADGTRIVAGYSDGTVRLWNPADGALLVRLLLHPRASGIVALSLDGRTLAGGGTDGDVRLVDAESGNPFRRLAPGPAPDDVPAVRVARPAPVRRVAFSPDGNVLAAVHGPFDRFVHVWDPHTGHQLAWLPEAGNAVESIVFSPDGATLATASDAGQQITLWETSTWRARRRLDCGGAPEYPAAFSPDGASLWSMTGDEIWRWDLSTGRRLQHFTGGPRSRFTSMCLFPSGTSVVSGSDDGEVTIWNVPAGTGSPNSASARAADVPIEGLWGALAGEDAAAAYDAVWGLAAVPDRSVPYLRNRLPRRETVDAGRVTHLMDQLDAEDFAARERATKALAELGDAAEPYLRTRRSATRSPEVGERIDVLLESLAGSAADADTLRALRAVEVLERIATNDARDVLGELARGSAGARARTRAAAALRRLDRLPPALSSDTRSK